MKKYYCNNCNSEVPENVKYCPHCGYALDDEEEIKKIQKKSNKSTNTIKSEGQNVSINNGQASNNYPYYYSPTPINKKGDMIKTYEWLITYGTLTKWMVILLGVYFCIIEFEYNGLLGIIILISFIGWGIMIEVSSKWKAYMLKLLYEIRNEEK